MRAMSLAIALMLGIGPSCLAQQPSQVPKTDPATGGGTGSTSGTTGTGTTSTGGVTGSIAPPFRSLDEVLMQALKSNPDLRVAESKVREAEAEYNRVRIQVMQKVVKLEFDIKDAKEKVAQLTIRHDRTNAQFKRGTTPAQEFETAQAELLAAKAALARLEGELPFLLGKQPQLAKVWSGDPNVAGGIVNIDFGNDGTRYLAGSGLSFTFSAPPPGSTTDKIRKALDTPITLKFEDRSFDNVLEAFRKSAKGINLMANAKDVNKDLRFDVDMSEPVALGAALQWLEDQTSLRFVLREYGIVAVPQAKLPPGAVGVVEFWRTGHHTDKAASGGLMLGQNMRAVTLQVPQERAGGGMIRKDDLIDVYLTTTINNSNGKNSATATALIAPGLTVLDKTGARGEGENKLITHTLQANAYRAALIGFAQNKGYITLVPRGPAAKPTMQDPEGFNKDEERRIIDHLENGHPITDRDLIELFKLAPLSQPRTERYEFAVPIRSATSGPAGSELKSPGKQ